MPATEHPMQALEAYLPAGTFDKVVVFLHQYKVDLTITKERASILGDYRNAVHGKNHRISVNGNLNRYAFLITLLHELAHLLTHEKYGHRVSSHGKEWKALYSYLLKDFMGAGVFPVDINRALLNSVQNPGASSCSEEELTRVLRNYDPPKKGVQMIETVPAGAIFITRDGRRFIKGGKLRKRYKCKEVATGLSYLFSGLYEVKLDAAGA